MIVVATERRARSEPAHPGGRLETLVATDDRVRAYGVLQAEQRQGPCVFAVDAASLVHVLDARHDRRRPDYLEAATRLGLRSQIGVHVFGDVESLGGLSICSEEHDPVRDT